MHFTVCDYPGRFYDGENKTHLTIDDKQVENVAETRQRLGDKVWGNPYVGVPPIKTLETKLRSLINLGIMMTKKNTFKPRFLQKKWEKQH